MNSKHKGALTELQCATYLYELGYDISIPWGDNCRYDFILDVNGKLLKIQVKTSRQVEEGVWVFNTRNVAVNSHGYTQKPYTAEQIDYFATFIEGVCYLVPIEETANREKRLRFIPPKNNQSKNITFAKEYEALAQLSKIK